VGDAGGEWYIGPAGERGDCGRDDRDLARSVQVLASHGHFRALKSIDAEWVASAVQLSMGMMWSTDGLVSMLRRPKFRSG
jgi:hypothetical protein